MIKGQKIYVVHVPRTSAQGRHTYEYKRDDGTTSSMGRTRSKGISIPFSFVRNGNQLLTGLDELIDNPYYEFIKKFKPNVLTAKKFYPSQVDENIILQKNTNM